MTDDRETDDLAGEVERYRAIPKDVTHEPGPTRRSPDLDALAGQYAEIRWYEFDEDVDGFPQVTEHREHATVGQPYYGPEHMHLHEEHDEEDDEHDD